MNDWDWWNFTMGFGIGGGMVILLGMIFLFIYNIS